MASAAGKEGGGGGARLCAGAVHGVRPLHLAKALNLELCLQAREIHGLLHVDAPLHHRHPQHKRAQHIDNNG